jgi:methyl acetate hydrolase
MPDTTTLRTYADAVLAEGARGRAVPGVVAAVTTADSTIYESAFGFRDLAADTAMTTDTVFAIASMTKAVASAGVLQAVERGLLDLDAPAGDVLPWLREVKVLTGYAPDGTPLLRAPARPVTLRRLLSHTSGFGYSSWSPLIARWLERHPAPFATHSFIRAPLLFDPGTSWAYGIGIDWAGLMLEAVTGMGLEAWLKENMFGPLGMTASWRLTPGTAARRAGRHHREDDGRIVSLPQAEPRGGDFDSGGSGIFTTAADYLKFVRMILSGGHAPDGTQVLKPETVALMSDPGAATGNTVLPLISCNPFSSNSGEFMPGIPKRHGLGFVVNESRAATGRSPGSLCWAGIANCYFWIDPTAGIGGVFLTQILPFMDIGALPLFERFETAVYSAL